MFAYRDQDDKSKCFVRNRRFSFLSSVSWQGHETSKFCTDSFVLDLKIWFSDHLWRQLSICSKMYGFDCCLNLEIFLEASILVLKM
jgi:hypothetical protein